jgi:signal transduction histidine kinase
MDAAPDGDSDSPGSVIAARLEEDRREILAAYERALENMNSLIIRDPVARSQAMTHAGQILSDVVRSLRVGRPDADAGSGNLSRHIGETRAAQETHPRESLRAAVALFEVILTAAGRNAYTGLSFDVFSIIALALNQSISARVTDGTIAYSGYLLSKIHEAHVDERRRIARELHDHVGHGMSVAHRQLELFHIYRETDPVKAVNGAETAQQAVADAMESLRALTTGLRLHDPLNSLEKALTTYVESLSENGTSVWIRVNGDETWASPIVRDETFLIIREAIRNAVTHGAPSRVIVSVDIAPNELRAWVEDDGNGFDASSAPAAGGLGMSSMRERAALMGGRVTINAKPNRGTQVELLVPLEGFFDDGSRLSYEDSDR